MGSQHPVEQPNEVRTPSERLRHLRQRFEAAWAEAGGGPPPVLDAFLEGVAEPERSVIRGELEQIERQFRSRLGADQGATTEETVDAPGPGKGATDRGSAAEIFTDPELCLSDTGFELTDPPAAAQGATMDYPSGPALPADAPALSGDTVDVAPPGSARPEAKTTYPTVEGYEIVGELGRGGMGVVYQARQKGLNRLVALKMILAGAHAGPLQLARFHTEAEAVARLTHLNIVQIYEVGEQDGLPFFSLEYVDGGSLSQLINRKPLPPRKAAQLLAMLAQGMHYAHQAGIIHRDLKPANVLLTADGLPKITDFGLAKRLEEGAAGPTQSGSLMGSPSYMAPEQARGDTREVGPLADVYALGAVLYETITGRPPFMGATILETLEQVRKEEPVPPSRLIPKTPKDLETICLKCLQKEPPKRYASAGALAEDLDRYLAGEPIRARPVSNAERLWRWGKRNPRVAGLAATILLLLVAGVVGSTAAAVTIAQERNQKELERQAAEDARALAEQRKQEAEAAHEQAQKNADEALKQSKLALRSFGTLIDEVQKQIGDNPGTQPLKAKLLETALDGLDKVAKSDEDSRLLGQSMAAAYLKMGQLFQQLGQSEKAFAQYEKAHEITQALAAKDPEGDVARANLAATFTMLGEMSLELRRDMNASLDYYQKALALRKELNGRPLSDKLDPTKVKQELAESHTRVGVTFLRLGEAGKALEYFREALRLRQELADAAPKDAVAQLDLARSHNAVAEVRFRSGDFAATREHFAQGLAVCDRVQQENPQQPRYKWELANTLGNFGVFEVRTGNLDEARKHYDRYLALMQELADLDPKNALYKRYLGLAHYRCATLARRSGDAAEAERGNRKCHDIREELAAADAKSERRRMELTLVLPRVGQHARAAEEAAKFRQAPSADREVLVEVAQCYAQCAAAAADSPELRRQYTERALEALTQALAQGYKDRVILETEPDLDALRDQPDFQALLARLQKGP